MATKIKEILDLGDDRLLIRGEVGGEPVEAQGWRSAIDNNFPDSAYVEVDEKMVESEDQPYGTVGRHLKPDAKPKKMTKKEIGAYAARLLEEAVGPAPAKPTKISFTQ